MCQRANPDCQVRGWNPPLVAVGAWDGVRFCPYRFHPFCLLVDDWSQCWVTIMAVACICIPEMFASCRRTTAIWLQIRYECRFGDMILCSKVREAYEATQCLCAKGSWKLKLKCWNAEMSWSLPISSNIAMKWVASCCLHLPPGGRLSWQKAWQADRHGEVAGWDRLWTWSPSVSLPVMPWWWCPCEAMQPGFAGLPRWNRSGNLWKFSKIWERHTTSYGSIWVHIRWPEMSNWPKYTRLWKCLVALFSWLGGDFAVHRSVVTTADYI